MLLKSFIASLLFISASFSAHATVIDFESTGTPNSINNLDYDIDGFIFNTTMTNVDISSSSPWARNGAAYSGDFAALNDQYGGHGEMTLLSGGTFDFNNLYLKGWWNDPVDVTITGLLGGTVIGSITQSSGTTWTNFIGNFVGIDTLHIAVPSTPGPVGYLFLIDDIRVNEPVPEPQTYAMFLAGLGLIGFTARRKS
ncbi:MAG TPA: PEP-CTERM sorting domain-containing protein [Methyloradius sp.]